MSETTEVVPPGVDPTQVSAARLYDYVLGGTHNLEVDRVAADKAAQVVTEIHDIALTNRGFQQRAAAWLATHTTIRQFLDIGSGLPTQQNTHEIVQAQENAHDAHVVYVDNDPTVQAYSDELLKSAPNTAFVLGDIREPDTLLNHPKVLALIDFTKPVGLIMGAIMHLVSDEANPAALVARYRDAVPAGSYLALSHMTGDGQDPQSVQQMRNLLERSQPLYLRTKAEVEAMFTGCVLVPPHEGASPEITYAGYWGVEDPDHPDVDTPGMRWIYCGVAQLL